MDPRPYVLTLSRTSGEGPARVTISAFADTLDGSRGQLATVARAIYGGYDAARVERISPTEHRYTHPGRKDVLTINERAA